MIDGDESTATLRIMEAVSPSADLERALYRLVEVVVEVTASDRAVIFLVADGRLTPKAVAARRPNLELFRRFRKMRPIDLGEVPERLQLLAPDSVAVIDDAATSPLVPRQWVEDFGTASVAAAPLIVEGETLGVLVVDYLQPHRFTASETNLIRSIALGARITLSNAAVHERLQRTAQIQRKLVAGIMAVSSAVELDDVLGSLAGCVTALFPGRSCSIALMGQEVAAAEGTRTAFPLRTGQAVYGYLTVTGDPPLAPDEMHLVDAFATQAAVAIERSQLTMELRSRLRRTEALYGLADLLAGFRHLDTVLRRINEEVCSDGGFECVEVAFRSAKLADAVGARPMAPEEVAQMARLEHETTRLVDAHNGQLATGIRVNGRVAGLLLVRSLAADGEISTEDESLIHALAGGIGEVAGKVRLQETLRATRSRLDVSRDQRQLSDEFDATMGRTLSSLWDVLSRTAVRSASGQPVGEEIVKARNLVAQAFSELQGAEESRSTLIMRSKGFHSAVKELLRSFEDAAGVSTTFRVVGTQAQLPRTTEEALFAIVFESIATFERLARATTLIVTVEYGDRVVLTIRDDGVGLAERGGQGPRPGVHYGLRAIRERAAQIGATAELESAQPRGAQLVVTVPVGAAMPPRPVQVRHSAAIHHLRPSEMEPESETGSG